MAKQDHIPNPEGAFSGLAGEVVHTFEPYTEADPVALLLSLLVAFGNLVGHRAHFAAEATRHHLNLFCVLVGDTADARKGASWAQVRCLFELAAPDWVASSLRHGLTSGGGLLHAVRDPVLRRQTAWHKGSPSGSHLVTADYGEDEKRLLVVEEDFAPTLHRLARRGNTLSSVLRAAWDRGDLHVLTRSRATRATSAHLSLIAHITPDELRHSLPASEIAGGFANRFLWACVRRSKFLPDGETLALHQARPLAERIAAAADSARLAGRLTRDPAARTLWRQHYPALSRPPLGIVSQVVARGAPQVMRLACLYALLDRAPHVQPPHLEAALALWHYCYDSAHLLFTTASAGPLSERLLRALQESDQGLTRTELGALLGRNCPSAEISTALRSLAAHGLAAPCKEGNGKGRPVERWIAIAAGGIS